MNCKINYKPFTTSRTKKPMTNAPQISSQNFFKSSKIQERSRDDPPGQHTNLKIKSIVIVRSLVGKIPQISKRALFLQNLVKNRV